MDERLRLGAGVYAKARRDESTHQVMPVVDVETPGREVARKLKAQVADSGDGRLTGDRRVSRKLALGQNRNAVQYVNNRKNVEALCLRVLLVLRSYPLSPRLICFIASMPHVPCQRGGCAGLP